jgi:hypothetical protein
MELDAFLGASANDPPYVPEGPRLEGGREPPPVLLFGTAVAMATAAAERVRVHLHDVNVLDAGAGDPVGAVAPLPTPHVQHATGTVQTQGLPQERVLGVAEWPATPDPDRSWPGWTGPRMHSRVRKGLYASMRLWTSNPE